MNRINQSLFSSGEMNSDMPPCPKCGNKLVFKSSAKGPFYGCSNYPQCDFSKPLHDASVSVIKTMEDSECPSCQHPLAVKKGRYGLFIGCTNYPDCHYIAPVTENTDTRITCPACKKGELLEKTNRYGKVFYSCSNFPACRYVVNSPPVAAPCPECSWPILINKQGKYVCPQKACEFKIDENEFRARFGAD